MVYELNRKDIVDRLKEIRRMIEEMESQTYDGDISQNSLIQLFEELVDDVSALTKEVLEKY